MEKALGPAKYSTQNDEKNGREKKNHDARERMKETLRFITAPILSQKTTAHDSKPVRSNSDGDGAKHKCQAACHFRLEEIAIKYGDGD